MTLRKGSGAVVTFDNCPVGSALFLDANLFLYNDAPPVVLMQRHGLSMLASLDADFGRVPGITCCTPV